MIHSYWYIHCIFHLKTEFPLTQPLGCGERQSTELLMMSPGFPLETAFKSHLTKKAVTSSPTDTCVIPSENGTENRTMIDTESNLNLQVSIDAQC